MATTPTLDQKVRKRLKRDPVPFAEITKRLPDESPADIRAALLRLNALGIAEICYGRGWQLKGGA